MSKRKQRFLKHLYHSAQINPQPEVPFQTDEGLSRLSKRQKVPVTAESGECNVCSAPCSSCLHVAGVLMRSKTKKFYEEQYRENTLSYSVDDVATTVRQRRSKIGQHATSESSNLMNSESSHDSFTENAQSKAHLRTSDVSGASDNVESSAKLSSVEFLGVKNHSLRSDSLTNKNYSALKVDDQRGLEGHDDNISSVSGAEQTNKSSVSVIQTERIKLPSSFTSADSVAVESHEKGVLFQTASNSLEIKFDVEGSSDNGSQSRCNEEPPKNVSSGLHTSSELSSQNSELIGNHSDKLADNGIRAHDLKSVSHTSCGEFVSSTLTSQDLVEDSCSHLKGKPEYSTREHSNSLMKREDVYNIQKPPSYISDDVQNRKVSFDDKKLELGTKNDVGDLSDEALNFEEQSREVEKDGDFRSLLEVKTTSFQSHHVDESDESDIVEHDVKVCDICGDAGREDLLAICSRCSDGAEHTYCMRERLDKVPEDDWLCEECKSTEEVGIRGQDRSDTEDRAAKDLPCGKDRSATVRARLDAKVPDVEGITPIKGSTCAKGSGKRQADDTEVSTASKRQALEPVIASPKAAHPSRVRSLSRHSSFKNLDIEKVKPTQKFSSGMHFPNDTSEAARSPTTGSRLQSTGGGFVKSSSFSFSNAKSKVKLVDEVPHKHRSCKDAASRDAKEGAVRGIGKSSSFKSIIPARLSTGESKVKMFSPKFSHVEDLKGLKHTNEKNLFERKNSFRSPRSSINPTTSGSTISVPKGDQKLTSRGESVSLSSTSNAELKAVQSDSRSISAAKPLKHGPRRSAEGPPSTGGLKRQLSCLPSVAGAVSTSSLVERKTVEACMKDESLSDSPTGEDELPRARESTYLSERLKESSTSHPRQTSDAGVDSVPCQKCKEIGHSAEFCTVDSNRSLGFDSSVRRTSNEEINKGSKLKAAIEAAMLKKPSIYRRNRIPSQADEISVCSIRNGSVSQDQLSNSSSMRSMNSVVVIEGVAMRNSDANLSKLPNGTDAKQLMVIPDEALNASSGDGSSMVPSDGKHLNMELPSHASVAMTLLLQMSAIPDHEYIWQGSFEVHRGRKTPELWDGFQAHLSTCASPKVIAAVNQFPRRVLLNEVPRLSTWPVQFEESGVRENNIALYFFAREYESYERSYKILLERMMRNDLALKGNIDGVELLIFPSNRLPEKSQRWNMLYFFWGVFREKKERCLQQGPVSPKKFGSANIVVTTAPALVELGSFSSEETKNMERHNCKPSSSSASAQIRLDESSPMRFAHINSDSKGDKELPVSVEVTRNNTMSEKAGTSRTKVGNDSDEANASKKQKTGSFEWNNGNASFVKRDGFASGGDLSSPTKVEKQCNGPPIPMTAEIKGERFFFPVDPPREVKGENLVPWSDDKDKPPERSRTPNLELALGGEVKTFKIDINLDEEPGEEEEALGAEVKSFRVGMLDINLDELPPPEEEEEGEVLSLSLSVPVPETERRAALFGGFSGE